MLDRMPEGVFIVGRLYPTDTNAAGTPWVPKGQSSRIVSTAAVSFHPTSRETFLSLKPPDEDAYLCNIAVVCRSQIFCLMMIG